MLPALLLLLSLNALTIRVEDPHGHPMPFVRIVALGSDGSARQARTGTEGESVLEGINFPARIQVLAPGFAPVEQEVAQQPPGPLVIELQRPSASDVVTVTASPAETAFSSSTQDVVSVPAEQLQHSPAITLDDRLRAIPGFTLFRRSGSLVAHPTAQGVSLRGVGPSGASRALVMVDSVPLNDPFGGWVYWARVPTLSIDRVEVVRGGASDLYGTDALGGVVQLFRRRPAPSTFEAEAILGSFNTSQYAFYSSETAGRHGFSLAGDLFRTGGYTLIAPSERGPVDIAARSRHHDLEATWNFALNNSATVYAAVSEFSEHRGNGTSLQTNDTQLRSFSAGTSFMTGRSEWGVQIFGLDEVFDSLFTAVAADRTSEALTRSQRVPARSGGAQLSWRRNVGTRHLLAAGGDYTAVRGTSDEIAFNAGRPTARVSAGGRQDRGGFFVQDVFRATEALEVVAGVRRDAVDAERAWSPKLGARLRLSPALSVRGSVSRSFRAPTLNELYRSFRVGNVVTNANSALAPERATSGELGTDWTINKVTLRATGFWTQIDGTVANVTISSTPTLITRQRRNIGSSRSRGIELDTAYSPSPLWTLSAGYFFADATVRPGGLRIPQVPRHQAVFQVGFGRPDRYYANVLLRFSGTQFDDDLNRFPLGGYQLVDVSAGKSLNRWSQLFVACENIGNQTYAVGRTPVETIGTPRRFQAGIRFRVANP